MLDMFKDKELPAAVSTYYKKIVPLPYNQGFLGLFGVIKKISTFFIGLKRSIPREPTSINDMKIWAHKSTALACQTLMLSLRAFGYDSCPMEGIDSFRIKKLLKLPKKNQDLRIDLPTVGVNTIKKCANIGIKGIVVKANQNIFLDKRKCLSFANKNKMFIISI